MEKMEEAVKNSTVDEVLGNEVEETGKDPWVEIYKKIDNEDDREFITSVMYIKGVGCIVRETLMFDGDLQMGTVFVPGTKLEGGEIVKE